MKNVNEYIGKGLEGISKFNRTDIEEIVKWFSYYLSSTNREYLYNETYLPSFVGDFCELSMNFKRKQNNLTVVANSASNELSKFEKIVFDNCWYYNKNTKQICVLETFSLSNLLKTNDTFIVKYTAKVENELCTYCYKLNSKEIQNKTKKLWKKIGI